jgi:hypothetical protein
MYIIGGLFALLGVWTFVRWIMTGWKRFVETVNDLTSTLKDAAEIAKAYREDVQILKQIAQSAPTPNFGEDPESIIPSQVPVQTTMPPPYWGRYPIKPEEPDAPLESVRDVDMTPTDEELMDQARNEQAADFETQERQKAATREADQARVKELADLGINTKPEGQ